MTAEPALAEVHRFLDRHRVLTLAYCGPEGPAACAVWFAARADLELYFLSALSTHHGAALRDGGAVAFAVHKDEQDWRSIQGIQGRGWCSPVNTAEHAAAWQIYTARYPFVIRQALNLQAALSRTTLWLVRPSWIRLVDNTRGFGFKQEWRFEL